MSDEWQGREFKYKWQLFSDHHVCNGRPPDKAVTFLMAKKRTHTNHENSALLNFSVDVKFWMYGIVTLEA